MLQVLSISNSALSMTPGNLLLGVLTFYCSHMMQRKTLIHLSPKGYKDTSVETEHWLKTLKIKTKTNILSKTISLLVPWHITSWSLLQDYSYMIVTLFLFFFFSSGMPHWLDVTVVLIVQYINRTPFNILYPSKNINYTQKNNKDVGYLSFYLVDVIGYLGLYHGCKP